MRVSSALAALVAFWLVQPFPRNVVAQEFVYVQKDIVWKDGHAANSDRITIMVFNDEQRMFSISATLRRQATKKTVAMNLKAGYLLYCGNWTKSSASEIIVVDHLLEAYKYRPNKDDLTNHERTYKLELFGDPVGSLTDTLNDGMRSYQKLAGFVPPIDNFQSFRFVCQQTR